MERPMDNWNDERLDELSRRMDEGFKEMREGFSRIEQRFEKVATREEMGRLEDLRPPTGLRIGQVPHAETLGLRADQGGGRADRGTSRRRPARVGQG